MKKLKPFTKKNSLILIFLFALQSIGQAETIFVSASKLEEEVSDIPVSFSYVDLEEDRYKNTFFIRDAIDSVSGVHIANQGGAGKVSSLFLRGSNSSDVLVLINGIEVNDAIAPSGGYDFARLNTSMIERVEILKGTHSVLYGSNALGGVINIITKENAQNKTVFSNSYGSFNTRVSSISGGFSNKKTRVNYSTSYHHSDGYTSSGELYGNSEEDGFNQFDAKIKLIKDLDKARLSFLQTYTKSRAEIDDSGGANGDDPNSIQRAEEANTKAEAHLYLTESLENKVSLKHSLVDRVNFDPPNNLGDSASLNEFKASRTTIENQTDYFIDGNKTLKLGLELERERGEAATSGKIERDSYAIFSLYRQSLKNINLSLGTRFDDYSESSLNYLSNRFALKYDLSEILSVKASVSNGFKAPTLYQLFDTVYGNPNLRNQKVFSYDIGFLLKKDKTSLGLNLFDSRYDFLITSASAPSFQFINLDKTKISGFDIELKKDFKNFSVKLVYDHLFSKKDLNTGLELVRRPKNKIFAGIDYWFNDNLTVSSDIQFVGEREDLDSSSFTTRVTLPRYEVFNLSALYGLNEKLGLHLKVENVFDRTYEVVHGFENLGRSFTLSANYSI